MGFYMSKGNQSHTGVSSNTDLYQSSCFYMYQDKKRHIFRYAQNTKFKSKTKFKFKRKFKYKTKCKKHPNRCFLSFHPSIHLTTSLTRVRTLKFTSRQLLSHLIYKVPQMLLKIVCTLFKELFRTLIKNSNFVR